MQLDPEIVLETVKEAVKSFGSFRQAVMETLATLGFEPELPDPSSGPRRDRPSFHLRVSHSEGDGVCRFEGLRQRANEPGVGDVGSVDDPDAVVGRLLQDAAV